MLVLSPFVLSTKIHMHDFKVIKNSNCHQYFRETRDILLYYDKNTTKPEN